jgi:WS/DGAT/MGAT family acyltransferase
VERLSGQDSSFLALETPTTHMHIGWAAFLDPQGRRPPAERDLHRLVTDRIGRLPAFRHRLASARLGLVQPDWLDAEVDPVHHVVVHDTTDLATLCGDVLSVPLDRSRPLWELHLAPHLPDGRVGLVMKLHHAIVDGPSGAELMVALLDLEPELASAALPPPALTDHAARPTAPRSTTLRRLARGPRRAAADLRRAAQVNRAVRRWDATHPGQRPPAPFTAPWSAINGRVTARRCVAFTSVPLAEVHRLRAVAGATVNDLALALVGGSLRRWLAARSELPHRSLVAMVPVSVRGDDDAPGGNRTSALWTTLATDCPDAYERLARIARVTGAAKRRHDETGVGELVRLADLVPPGPEAWLARRGGSRALSRQAPLPFNVVVSNVPGPDTPFYCCRALVEEAYPMGPLTAWTGLNITVLSYRDRLSFGLVMCPDVIDDVDGLLAGFDEELDDLDRAVAAANGRGA